MRASGVELICRFYTRRELPMTTWRCGRKRVRVLRGGVVVIVLCDVGVTTVIGLHCDSSCGGGVRAHFSRQQMARRAQRERTN